MRVTLVTLDGHLASAAERAFDRLRRVAPGLRCSMHCAGEWAGNPDALQRCLDDISNAHVIIACMLFVDEHIKAVLPALQARRDDCDAMLCFMSAGEIIRLTRMGGLDMSAKQTGPLALLKKLRGGRKKAGAPKDGSSGAKQLRMLRRLPRILRFIPGTAQDLRVYFLGMQYWLAGSEDNIRNLVAVAVSHYADGPRRPLRELIEAEPPVDYPDVGLYHPRAREVLFSDPARLPKGPKDCVGTVGLLLMRSYVLSGNVHHYDAVITALEDRGLRVIPAYAAGLDARPVVDAYFRKDGKTTVDALVSLTGFSLIGGPAYNDSRAAEEVLTELDVPYLAAHATEFQTLEQWSDSDHGLLPVETTMMVAIPELDGAANPILFGGRSRDAAEDRVRDMHPHPERAARLAARVARLVRLRGLPADQRKVAIVLFNFPPNAGAVGTAAHLGVFRSLYNTLASLRDDGYDVDLPDSVDALRREVLEGNASDFGADANVHARIPVDDHVRKLPWLEEVERAWGPAPGRHQTDGRTLHVLGRRFGNVLVGIQPAFGYEGDPMRLLFDRNLAPTHAFTAFYHYLRTGFDADAVLHFGTHGALEFMPGKQSGMSGECWPDRLIGDLPNFYLYAANNPSEGTIAKRRAAATLISYLTPPLAECGLYSGLADLQASIDHWRTLAPELSEQRDELAGLIREQARAVDLLEEDGPGQDDPEAAVQRLIAKLREINHTLIPEGLHVVGEVPDAKQRAQWLSVLAAEDAGAELAPELIERLVAGEPPARLARSLDDDQRRLLERLAQVDRSLQEDAELPALSRALDGRFLRPVPGGDLLRNPQILPTGRNLHGFDPSRIPSAWALRVGAGQAEELLERFREDSGELPESIALVLWGSDNLKTEGGPIAQALRLMGARPRHDSYGRLAGAELLPLEELGRPRIDVVMTLSGIFRDLLPDQVRLLAEAAWLAACADEPVERNFIRAHALAYAQAHDCDLETAALRVFSNAAGAYGSNVNMLVDDGSWEDEDELAEQYTSRKCFAYGRSGPPRREAELLNDALSHVEFTYQNLESAELGVTTIDHYFDTLGGISRAAKRARGGAEIEVYIGDQTRGGNVIRTLADQVALETRTRLLNPTWYEGLLEHGYEGVKQIDAHVANTLGWSATTLKVQPWVYQQLTDTFVLDKEMRERLAELNPTASARVAHRLLEACERDYWQPDDETREQLERAGEELEDRLEGISEVAAA
jgi:magnesium chelatase subunit H